MRLYNLTQQEQQQRCRSFCHGKIACVGTHGEVFCDNVLAALLRPQRGVLKDALTAYGHRYYAATQDEEGNVEIFTALINGGTCAGDESVSWGYKDIGEAMGPNEHDCPLGILELATEPAPNEYAKAWREQVRDYWATRRTATRQARLLERGYKVWIRHYSKNPYTVHGTKPLCGFNAAGEFYRIPTTRIERIEAPST